MKRLLDCTASLLGLLLLSPLFLLVAMLVKLDSPGPVLFRQERVGRGFRLFRILKFRSMRLEEGTPITAGQDSRITRMGKFLRRTKIDELPQLVNVLAGDMSLVGPRPEIREYVAMFSDDYAKILRVRPGITDLASLAYSDEASALSRSPDPEGAYIERILPRKIALAHQYLASASLGFDLRLIFRTFARLGAVNRNESTN